MKHIIIFLVSLFMGIAILISCSSDHKYSQPKEESVSLYDANMESEASYEMKSTQAASITEVNDMTSKFISSSAASTINDGSRKLIRTAQLRFKVKNIPEATRIIEDIIIQNRGIILKSHVNNTNRHVEHIDISKDSALLIHHINLNATLEVRVSCDLLDSVLRKIEPLSLFTDFRTVEAEDITARLMTEQLKRMRLDIKQKRIANNISTRSGKLNDVMDAENALDNAMEEADRTKVAEYVQNDRIAFSTIHIQLYQDEIIYKEKIQRTDITSYEPGIGTRTWDALCFGANIMGELLIFILSVWPLWLIIALSIFIYMRITKRKNKSSDNPKGHIQD